MQKLGYSHVILIRLIYRVAFREVENCITVIVIPVLVCNYGLITRIKCIYVLRLERVKPKRPTPFHFVRNECK